MNKLIVNYKRTEDCKYKKFKTKINSKNKEYYVLYKNNYFEIDHTNYFNKKILFNFLYENFSYILINKVTIVILNIDKLNKNNQKQLLKFLNTKNKIEIILTCTNLCFVIKNIKNNCIIIKNKLNFKKEDITQINKIIKSKNINSDNLREILYYYLINGSIYNLFKTLFYKYNSKEQIKIAAKYNNIFKHNPFICIETYIYELNQQFLQSKSYLQH